MQFFHQRLLDVDLRAFSHVFGHLGSPIFQSGIERQHQISLHGGFIHIMCEHHLEAGFGHVVLELHRTRGSKYRVGCVAEQHLVFARIQSFIKLVQRRRVPCCRSHLWEWHDRSTFNRLADIAQHLVEQIDRGRILRTVRIAFRCSAHQHQARCALFQKCNDLVDLLGRHPGILADALLVITPHRGCHIASCGPQCIDDTQSQDTFRSGTHREPTVRICASDGHL